MDVSPAQLTSQGTQASASKAASAALSSDFETFLKMLTTQMANQDPLNPMESSDFALQLATFSGVEQQVQTNQLLEGLAQSMGAGNMAQLAGWVGMEARAEAPAAFSGRPITVVPSPPAEASTVDLVVRDAEGVEQDRVRIGASGSPLDWTGELMGGGMAAPGTYSFETEALDEAGEVISTDPAEVYVPVTEARNAGGQVRLVLAGGAEVAASEIVSVRAGQ
ncbi:flagellar hook capping FlgD N-terminal domain-containing protein [Roseicyclus sp. F158]|uniref:Basal-body rod modification protein FlgD n=1 Tax=Tropicimonas omnivorans TaxID=3075590 RepID=A0ABU3DEZ8_9RHOB|nr:flagellar hook capping FlgD N-terminal domain-containing protein [Roseicyclus sp. F158]MDT0681702.1 flagellar hook capping FlgD N-terminal domain-containing protein [Roseicyclus sp. F158]